MNDPFGTLAQKFASVPSGKVSRALSVFVALGTGAVLATALWLTPSPLGYATHTQLGLGQCTFLSVTGIPCPMCGMTTTFTLLAHLRPLQAAVTQPFGLVLFSLTVFAFAVSFAEIFVPRDRWSRILRVAAPYETTLAVLFLVGMGLGWLYKIAVMRLA